MRRFASLMGLLVCLGCGPKHGSKLSVDPSVAPKIPSPYGMVYTKGESAPKDPVVASVVDQGMVWVESLSGAAGALAMDEERPPTIEGARWAAARAGYPHPVVQMIKGDVGPGVFPHELVPHIQQLLMEGDEVGLVRARTQEGDRWVALVGRPGGEIQPFPREIALNGKLGLRAVVAGAVEPSGQAVLVSPTGVLTYEQIPTSLTLDEPGEWWVEISSPDGTLMMSVPVYVEMNTPTAPVLDLPGEDVVDPTEAVDLALSLINEVRDTFSLHHLAMDGALNALAEHPLQLALDGDWDPSVGEARLRGAGFVGGPAYQVTCEGNTVASCLYSLMAHPLGRAALLNPQVHVAGASAQVTTEGVLMVLNLASQ